MDPTRIDAVARIFARGMTRRETLRGLVAGAAAVTAGGTVVHFEDASARRRRRKNSDNVCDGKNWCRDRTETCGSSGGSGKCLVDNSGKHICAELLFQAGSCEECGPDNCTNCRCVPARGGGDKCNNGPNGYEFVCVRKV